MNVDLWKTTAQLLAVFAGILFGSAAISSACWVWLRKQIFAFGGAALSGAGVILLGLSIWHSVEFGVGTTGLSLKLQAELDQRLRKIDARVASLDQASAVTQQQLAALTVEKTSLEKEIADARSHLAEIKVANATTEHCAAFRTSLPTRKELQGQIGALSSSQVEALAREMEPVLAGAGSQAQGLVHRLDPRNTRFSNPVVAKRVLETWVLMNNDVTGLQTWADAISRVNLQ